MSDSSLPQDVPSIPQDGLICKPTKWFLLRALAMLVMFSVFAVLFVKDGIWGYRDKNLQFYVHANFVQAGTEFQNMENDEGVSDSTWKSYAGAKKCTFPNDAGKIFPKGADLDMAWPDVLVNGYAVMSDKGAQNGAVKLWEEYSASKKWSSDPGEHPMDAGKIREQFYATGVAGLLIVTTLFFLIRTMRRSIRVDGEALYTQTGQRIAYADMVRIDKRKWDTKGLAIIDYNDGGESKKARIDGMVYGQFKEEEGAPAEKLLAYVMDRFKGEVVEYVTHEEDESEEKQEEGQPND
jgi:hypothetical protein